MPMPVIPAPDVRLTRYAATTARRFCVLITGVVQDSTSWENPDGGTRRIMDAYSPPNEYNAELSNLRLHAQSLLKNARLLCHGLGVRPEPSEYEANWLIDALVKHLAVQGEHEAAATLSDSDFLKGFGQEMGWVEPDGAGQ